MVIRYYAPSALEQADRPNSVESTKRTEPETSTPGWTTRTEPQAIHAQSGDGYYNSHWGINECSLPRGMR